MIKYMDHLLGSSMVHLWEKPSLLWTACCRDASPECHRRDGAERMLQHCPLYPHPGPKEPAGRGAGLPGETAYSAKQLLATGPRACQAALFPLGLGKHECSRKESSLSARHEEEAATG